MQENFSSQELIPLIEQRKKISIELGINDDTPQFWSEYRKIKCLIKNQKITGEKIGNKYHIDKVQFEEYLNQRKKSMPYADDMNQCTIVKDITIAEIKELILDLSEIGVEECKILALIKKKLHIQ